MQKTAVIFGATGLTGSLLLRQLCESGRYDSVVAFSRKNLSYTHPLLENIISNLKNTEEISEKVKGDDLFCCIGTTIKKAGSQEKFKKVDLDLPAALAQTAQKNGILKFLVISSIGANHQSSNFYLRTKGEMENHVLSTNIPHIYILRPSMLLGPRKEFRFGEEAGKILMKFIDPLLFGKLKKYRAIHAKTVASAMITLAQKNHQEQKIIESDEIKAIAGEESE